MLSQDTCIIIIITIISLLGPYVAHSVILEFIIFTVYVNLVNVFSVGLTFETSDSHPAYWLNLFRTEHSTQVYEKRRCFCIGLRVFLVRLHQRFGFLFSCTSEAARWRHRRGLKKVWNLSVFLGESVSQPTAYRIIIRETWNKFKRENFMFVRFDALTVVLTKTQVFRHVMLWRLAKCYWRFERS